MTSAEWEMWVRYSQDAQPANEAEAEAFERFRRSDDRAWARYEVEQQAWDRYMRGQEPANDGQAHWIEIFRQAGEPPEPHWLEGYWKEREACERFLDGKPPRNADEQQRFARFGQELADTGYSLHRRDESRGGADSDTGRMPVADSTPHHDRNDGPGSAHSSPGIWEQGQRSAHSQQRQGDAEAELEAGA